MATKNLNYIHMKDAKYWVNELKLLQHPEGGFYKEVYRSEKSFIPSEIGEKRNYITSIYFLIEAGNVSHFHSIQQDELWYYHAGAPLCVYRIIDDGTLECIKIGPNPEQGEVLQAMVPANSIFGSKSSGEFSLVSCVVAPGFDFADFKLHYKTELLQKYPQHKDIIDALGMD
jgi:predicted cupin superfamily sugar epimerase